MEFMNKTEREILLTLANSGGKADYSSILSKLSYLPEESIRKSIQSLYEKNYISILKENNNIVFVLDKKVGLSVQYLNLQKVLLSKGLDEFKTRLLNARNLQDKEKQAEEVKNATNDLLAIIGLALTRLLANNPELTIPEYLDLIKVINDEILSKVTSTIEDSLLKSLITNILGERSEQQKQLIYNNGLKNSIHTRIMKNTKI